MRLSDKQKEYWLNANSRWNIKQGATRSGKTYLDYFIIPKRIHACTGNGLILLLGNTKSTIERNILEPMRNLYGEQLVGTVGSNNTVPLFGRKCHVLGAEKVNMVSKLQGSGIEYCYGDEVTTWHEDVFTMLKSRLDRPNSKFDGTCNPDNPRHWFKIFLDSDADIYQQQYNIDDNPFLDSDFVENLKKEYSGVFYERFILGNWVVAEGLVYPMFDPQKHVGDVGDPGGQYYVSIDYGTVNPCSMGLWCIDKSRAVRVNEYYHDGRTSKQQKTDEEYYKALETLAGDRVIQSVIVDPSAASFIETIRRHGRFSVKKAVNDVLDGLRVSSSLLSAGKLHFNTCCKDIVHEFGLYSWDKESSTDRVIKEHDHAMDDMRYFCNTILKREFRWDIWS